MNFEWIISFLSSSYRSLSIQSISIALEAGKRKLALIELVAYDPNVVAGPLGSVVGITTYVRKTPSPSHVEHEYSIRNQPQRPTTHLCISPSIIIEVK